MARTADPHAATLKAWETRGRRQEGEGRAPTQVRGDFATGQWRDFPETKANPLWKQPKPEYDENVPYDETRKREKAWTSAMAEAMSLGEIGVREALDRGFNTNANEDNIVELPPRLYHVTTAASDVLREGLKSRDELGQERGVGLGGGDTDTISFTTDLKVAKDILRAMSEAHDLLNGKTTIADLDADAESGKDTGGTPYTADVDKLFAVHVGREGQARWREGYDPQMVGGGWPMKITDVPKGAKIAGEGWMGGDGIQRVIGYFKKLEPGSERDLELKWNYFRAHLTARERAGGPIDPLFFLSDPAALARRKKSELQLIEVEPHPRTRGFRESGLGEIRVFTGKVVKRLRVVP